jgi:hypothetical protein
MWAALLLLSACTCAIKVPVTVDDHTLYYQKQASADDWATEIHFLTQGTQDLTQAQWNAISEGMVCMGLGDWTDINKMISNFCSLKGVKCNFKLSNGQTFKQVLNDFFLRMQLTSGKTFQQID